MLTEHHILSIFLSPCTVCAMELALINQKEYRTRLILHISSKKPLSHQNPWAFRIAILPNLERCYSLSNEICNYLFKNNETIHGR